MVFKALDIVKVEIDTYANGKLVQTTNEKKGKEANLPIEHYEPQTVCIGKGMVLEAMDADLLKAKKGEKRVLELSVDQAYGPRKRDFIRTFPKKVFDEKKLRAVVGVTYDFNGMYGTVKSVAGGRVLVDFNNPLAGKDIRLEYTVVEEVKDIKEKLSFIFEKLLQLPKEMVQFEVKENNVVIRLPEQLLGMKEHFEKTFSDYISDVKEYSFSFEAIKGNSASKQ
jgi:FKBP-type peptidyl-prolyl cis-trans isomerase 2